MQNQISKSDFNFNLNGYGHYRVTYISPNTGKEWSAIVTDMELIDDTKNCDNPKIKDLNTLKRYCKQ